MSSYSEGFKIGYSTNAPLGGISEGIKMFAQEYRKQQEIGRQRQEAFDKARKEFKQKQEDTYGKFYREDLYDNTGFTDFDSLGDKFTRQALQNYEINEFAFRNGFITESELNSRNANIKAQSQKLTKLYTDANEMINKKAELEEKGLGNRLNDIKLEFMDNMAKNFKIVSGLDGMYMSTINKDGVQQNVSINDFGKALEASSGVDMQKDLDDLLKLGGYSEYKTKDGKNIIRSFERNDKRGKELIKTKIAGYTDEQVIDAMFELDLVTDDPEEAKKTGKKLISTENIFDTKVTEETRNTLADEMQKELQQQQKYKQITGEAKDDNTDIKTPKYDRSYYNKQSAADVGIDTDFNEYTFKEPKPVKGLTISGYKIPVPRNQSQVLEEPTVVAYRDLGNGDHFVKISSKIRVPKMIKTPEGKETQDGTIEEEKFTYVPLKTRTEVNQIRSIYGIPILTDQEEVNQTGILD